MSDAWHSPSRSELLRMSYRELQQLVRPLGVPCNLKKVYLQEVLHHSHHGSSSQVAGTVERALRERQEHAGRDSRRLTDERRKGFKRKITGPKERWDSIMATNSLTPLRQAKLRHRPAKDIMIRFKMSNVIKKAVQKQMYGLKHTVPVQVHNKRIRRSSRTNNAQSDVPCDRILRSNMFSICDKLEKRKIIQRTGEDLVSSSEDYVTASSLRARTFTDPFDAGRDMVYDYNKPHIGVFRLQYNYEEPIDFSFKNINKTAQNVDRNDNYRFQTNLTLQRTLQYERIASNTQSGVLAYRTVTQSENYQQRSSDQITMPSVGHGRDDRVTLYSQDQERVCVQRQLVNSQVENYAVNYSTRERSQTSEGHETERDGTYYGIVEFNERRCPQSCCENAPEHGTANRTPPYFHKKIRVDRRMYCRETDERPALENQACDEQNNFGRIVRIMHPKEINFQELVASVKNKLFSVDDMCQRGPIDTAADENEAKKTPDSTVNLDAFLVTNKENVNDMVTCCGESIAGPGVADVSTDSAACDDGIDSPVYESGGNTLPAISDVFPRLSKTKITYMRPLYVKIDDGAAGAEPPGLDINSNVVTQELETLLKSREPSVSSESSPPSPQSTQFPVRIESTHAEPEANATDLETIVSQIVSPWSDAGDGGPRAPSPVGIWDDVMGIISQEEGKLDSVQCVCCDWMGQAVNFENHIKEEHHDQIKLYESRLLCTHRFSLGELLRERRQAVLMRWNSHFYALLLKYNDPEWILASVVLLSPGGDSPPHRCTVTVYNQLTGEPFVWSGPLLKINAVEPSASLSLQMSRLGLFAHTDVMLWNGQLVQRSGAGKIVCGNLSLDDICIDVHVELAF